MESFRDLLVLRESCRSYTGEAVKMEDLLLCIEAARLAPSACNGQPWSFIVITNDQLKNDIVKLTQPFTKTAGAFIVLLEEKPSFPTKVVNKLKDQDYTQIDIGIAASHICLAAAELRLGTCMLGWFNEQKIKQLLSVPSSQRIRLVISVGHATNTDIKPKKRKDLDKLLTILD